MCDCRKRLSYDDMFYVGESLAETNGRREQSDLCIFGNS